MNAKAPAEDEVRADRPLPPGMTELRVLLFSIGMMLTMVLALLDQSIVAAAAPQILTDLHPVGGVGQFPWLITAYMLAATTAQPLYGRLSDNLGPKRIYLGALGVFLLGSVLCAFAQSMPQLIAFRAVQGLGGGGLMSMGLIVMATLYPPKERGTGAGIGGLLIALSLVAGPPLGSWLSDRFSWRWIFYVNLPVCVGAFVLIALSLRLAPPKGPRRGLDLIGAALIGAGASGLLLAAKEAGEPHVSTSGLLVPGAVGLALTVAFVVRQATTAEPLISLSVFRDPVFRLLAPLQFIGGFALLTLPMFVVTYLRVIRDDTAGSVVVHIVPMAIGIALVFLVWGRVLARTGRCKPVLVATTLISAAAAALAALLPIDTDPLFLDGCLVLLGVGVGGVTQVALFATQAAAPPERLGVITTAARFATTLGSAVGSAVLGAILNTRFASALSGTSVGATDEDALFEHLRTASGPVRDRLVHAYAAASDAVFVTSAVMIALAVLLAALVRDIRVDVAEPDVREPNVPEPDVPAPDVPAPNVAEPDSAPHL
jgi:EmrB/QacA subfamily drug resistance transporter